MIHILSLCNGERPSVFATLKRTDPHGANAGVWWVVAQMALLAALLVVPGSGAQWYSPATGVLAIAAALFSAAVLTMGRSLSPFPSPATRGTLITRGIFGLVRHPIYSAVMLGAAAFAAMTHSWQRGLLTLVLVLFLNSKATHEERLLNARYPSYKAYALTTKRFVPWVY